tara:strand:+ start:674 stop:1252 length:579 start_codon:yes stop_codon:yes gene_type:complete
MRYEKMTAIDGVKIIIDMKELRNCRRLEGAVIFNRLFNINNNGFNGEEMHKDDNDELTILCDYEITSKQWNSFMAFIRYGKIKFDIKSTFIESQKDLLVNELDNLTNSGVFIKFGPFPSFDDYVETCVSLLKQEKYLRTENPRRPEDDTDNLYHWIIVNDQRASPPIKDVWEVCGISNGNSRFWRKKWWIQS